MEIIAEVDSVLVDAHRQAGTMVALELSWLEACVAASLISLSWICVWALTLILSLRQGVRVHRGGRSNP